jgi:hypothetical protein
MAKKNNKSGTPKFSNEVSKNGVHKELTEAEKAGVKPISAWSWFFKNFGVICIACFVITPFGILKGWGSSAIWVPIVLFVAIAGVSTYHGIKMYKNLTSKGYVKKFGEK